MNYEEKYKQALETVQEILSSGADAIRIKTLKLRLQSVFPELAESEDERMRENLYKCLRYYVPEDIAEEYIAWLEKQGQTFTKKDVDDAYLKGVCDTKQELEKQGEKDPCIGCTNDKGCVTCENGNLKEIKVEPKFKVGDWIANGGANPCYVKSIFGDYYELCSCDGVEYTKHIIDVNYIYHLWTIADAKDGDVLVSGEVIFIFNKIHGVWINCHCSLHKDDSFCEKNYDLMHIKYAETIYPATKEQWDALFAKMKEAGYEWDAEDKKGLAIEVTEENNHYID